MYPQPSIHRDDPVYQIICLVCVVQALEEKCLFEKMGASGLHKVFECMPDYNPIVGADAGTPQASYQVCEQWFTCSNGPAPSAVLPLFLTACDVCIRWRSRGVTRRRHSRPNALMSTHPLMPTTGRGDRGEQGLGERPRNPATGPSMRTFVLGSARSPASGQPSHNVCVKRQIKLDSAHEWPGSASVNTPLPLARKHA